MAHRTLSTLASRYGPEQAALMATTRRLRQTPC
jgi:hypothetical protein